MATSPGALPRPEFRGFGSPQCPKPVLRAMAALAVAALFPFASAPRSPPTARREQRSAWRAAPAYEPDAKVVPKDKGYLPSAKPGGA